MSNEFRDLAYTAKATTGVGVAQALDVLDLDEDEFEVVIRPDGVNFSVRTETSEGAKRALENIAPRSYVAIVRVFEADQEAAGATA